MTNWIYCGTEVTEIAEKFVGYVYLITRLHDSKKYIGKKLTKFKKTSIKTVTLKSGIKKKKKVRTLVDSDWRDYFGSSDVLNESVKELGADAFSREILMFCKTLSELSYYEAKYQFESDCLLKDDYFNSWIMVRVRKNNLVKK